MRSPRERATDLGYAAGWRGVRALPEPVAARLFRAGADYATRRGGPDQLRRNLARVLATAPADVPDDLVRAAVRSYARYWREAFRLPSMDHAAVARSGRCTLTGRENLDAALDRGRGMILALPHSGNWDMAGVWLTQHYGRLSTVAERLRPESLFRRFVEYRESLGFEVFPLTGGEQPPIEIMAERLRGNGIVCLLSERDLQQHGVPVTFFGEPTRFVAGPAVLAERTGAALLPVGCWFTVDDDGVEGWHFRVGAPIGGDSAADVAPGAGAWVSWATQALAGEFESDIAAHPADWHMLQPLWLDDLSAARRERIAGASTATGQVTGASEATGQAAGASEATG